MPYKPNYSPEEIYVFQQRDLRIMWQSIFSSLCDLFDSRKIKFLKEDEINPNEKPPDFVKDLKEYTTELVQYVAEKYPTEKLKEKKLADLTSEEINEIIIQKEKGLEVLKKIKEGLPGF